MYAVVFSFGGIPLIYMGDELALRNDRRWDADPAHAHDNRWMHRPADGLGGGRPAARPGLAGRPGVRRDPRLARARRSLLALRAGGSTEMLPAENRSVLAYRRVHPRSAPFLSLTNFSDVPQSAGAWVLVRAGLDEPVHVHSSAGRLDLSDGGIELPPWGFAWLTGR